MKIWQMFRWRAMNRRIDLACSADCASSLGRSDPELEMKAAGSKPAASRPHSRTSHPFRLVRLLLPARSSGVGAAQTPLTAQERLVFPEPSQTTPYSFTADSTL